MWKSKKHPAPEQNELVEYINGLGKAPVARMEEALRHLGESIVDKLQGRLAKEDSSLLRQEQIALAQKALLEAAKKATKGKIILVDSDVEVKEWLRQHGAQFVSDINDDTRLALSLLIALGQSQRESPEQIAQRLRPLLGLNHQQMQANENYREMVYNELKGQGVGELRAKAQALSAANKYAQKQLRYRAETIVNTELSFAYNRGADIGIKRAIREGLMPRCKMIWSTAGTNRVCGRCLALKDKVIGYTDEDVTLPPLHPRCRCTIIYQEDGNVLSGALKPESVEAEQHAFRYYGLVRKMRTDCQRIATNTGFRKEDIARIKEHVFNKEHELYDGEKGRFYPSYHMAQSWQRLIDGRNIQPRDILLLNHEFLESVIESEGLIASEAHSIAERVYNYSVLIK